MGVEVRACVRPRTSPSTPTANTALALDEMAVMIAGTQFWLWRAVDDEGEVLDLLVQRRRDKAAAVRVMRKLLKKQGFAPGCAGDRQAALLRRGKVRNRIVGAPRAGVTQEQSG
jgi:transposase-like protein